MNKIVTSQKQFVSSNQGRIKVLERDFKNLADEVEKLKHNVPAVSGEPDFAELMSEMLDNPDEHGIYPTGRLMSKMETFVLDEMDALRQRAEKAEAELAKLVAACEESPTPQPAESEAWGAFTDAEWENCEREMLGDLEVVTIFREEFDSLLLDGRGWDSNRATPQPAPLVLSEAEIETMTAKWDKWSRDEGDKRNHTPMVVDSINQLLTERNK